MRVRVCRVQTALSTLVEHVRVDVGDGDVRLRIALDVGRVVEDAEGDVARAAGDVEYCPGFGGGTGR